MEPINARSDVRTKLIEATPAQVFAAIRDPSKVARWWGPDGFSSTIHQFEFHPGGWWRLTLHGPDGTDFPNEYRLVRIEPDRMVQIAHPSPDHCFVLTIELTRRGDATLVSWQQTFDQAEHYQPLAEFLAQANEQVLARLAAEVHPPSAA
ncbi:SRPBCC domain-containing protein [Chitiniphilus purpureus]|uniref:SRPBCC domain-containing protein n=1 Tax=Chitiniphilus purpureus TaxID=2981137 RepID=A0ABY6DH04_9NEIS|nr:SRPBCC domain-containing protein [Chitiniphilus sp. CD1]UXY13627.1 SRPBCC domain-containing protein [Chitiniphilus sp. CD1]